MPAENSGETARGRPFKPGQSGNPGGRPKMPEDVREAFRALVPEAIQTIVYVMRHGKKDKDRTDAANSIIDRAYGKPMQMQDISMDMAGSVDLTGQIRRVLLEAENDGHGIEAAD